MTRNTDISVVDEFTALLFRHDPIGIADKTNLDEYQPEAEAIAERMPDIPSPEATQQMVWEVFREWFDDTIAGDPDRYALASIDIWVAWRRRVV